MNKQAYKEYMNTKATKQLLVDVELHRRAGIVKATKSQPVAFINGGDEHNVISVHNERVIKLNPIK